MNLVGPFRLTKAIAGPMVLRGRRDDRQRHVGRRDRGLRALGRVRRVEGGARAAGPRLGRGAGRHRRPPPQRRPGRDGHAHARRRDPRRRPRRAGRPGARRRREIVALLAGRAGAGAGRARRHPHGTAPRRRQRRRSRHEARDDISRSGATTCGCWSSILTRRADAALRETRTPALPDFLAAGDLLIVNDAATVPASLRGRDDAGHEIEARLIAARARRSLQRRAVRRRRLAPAHGGSPAARRAAGRRAPAIRRAGRGDRRARAGVAAAGRPALRRRRRRAMGRALPRGPPHPVLVPRARPAAVGGADRLRRAPVGVRDAVGRAAAVVGDPARAAAQGRALGVAHARGGAERDRRSGDRRRPAARRALRDPGGDRARRDRDARPRRPRRRRRHDRRARARGRRARRKAACAPAPARPT